MNQVVLSISHLSKSYYGKRHGLHKALKMTNAIASDEATAIRAVDDVSLEIYEGEIFGLLGANGAGKSTVLKMLCGLTDSDSGEITLLGEKVDIYNCKFKEYIGALIEQPVFFPKNSARRNLQYLGTLNGNVTNKRIDEMAELFDMTARLDDNMCTYSLGMYQKIGVMQAIMHRPKLLILDEPTNGLDPKWIIEVRVILKRLAKEYGMTIIISSHILAEMQELCDRVAIIDKGKIVKSGAMSELLNTTQNSYSDIEYDVSDTMLAVNIANRYNCRVITRESLMLVRIEKDKIADFNRDLILSGIMINNINVRKQRLEDVFRAATVSGNNATNANSSGMSIDSLIEQGVVASVDNNANNTDNAVAEFNAEKTATGMDNTDNAVAEVKADKTVTGMDNTDNAVAKVKADKTATGISNKASVRKILKADKTVASIKSTDKANNEEVGHE